MPSFLRFGSWIGGDRDGNPYVTPEVTQKAVYMHAKTALKEYIKRAQKLSLFMTHCDQLMQPSDDFKNSLIKENIFENRFMHVAELQRLGAKISIKNNKAFIEGNTKFIGAELMSSDLRASVALVLAALVANGKSIVGRVYHLERGYENIVNKLKKIGVKIKRLK